MPSSSSLQYERIMQSVLALCAVSLTILFQTHPYWGKFGWLFFFILAGLNSDYAVYAAFYFAAFFIGSGFFPEIFFTLKHFHIAILVFIFIRLLKGEVTSGVSEKPSIFMTLLIWLMILAISFIAGYFGPHTKRVFMMNFNILSLWCVAAVLFVQIGSHEVVIKALSFFLLGAVTRSLLAILPSFPYAAFSEIILYNNHISFLANTALFITSAFLMHEKNWLKKSVYAGIAFCLVLTIILSCSRTAWMSLLITSAIAIYLFHQMNLKRTVIHQRTNSKLFFVLCGLLFLTLLTTTMIYNRPVFSRIIDFGRLGQSNYWEYTFNDHENFGFLGIYRLRQFQTLWDIFRAHPLIGIGFTRDVTDFHSIYFTVLGGTGALGFGLFILFCYLWIKNLLAKMFSLDDGLNLFRLGVLLAFLVWLLHSMMESFLIQFHVWVIFSTGLWLSKKNLGK